MRALNLAILLAGLTLVGFALHGMSAVDTSLRVAAAHQQQPAAPPHGDCDRDEQKQQRRL